MPRPLALLSASLLTACLDREISAVPPLQDHVEIRSVAADVRALDLLFVIDNSPSMQEEYASLVANFGRLLGRLDDIPGGLPDLRVGVITSDLGSGTASACPGTSDGGRLQGSACAQLGGHSYLSDARGPDGGRVRNYTGSLEDAFACMADVGYSGCGFEQHLAALDLALTAGVNPDFLRPDAMLAVVIIADEDDCSVSDPSMFLDWGTMGDFRCHSEGITCQDDPDPFAPGPRTGCRPRDDSRYLIRVQQLVDQLKRLKPNPSDLVVAGIIGDDDEVVIGRDANGRPAVLANCPAGGLGASEPGLRLHAFFDAFGERAIVESLCTNDLGGAIDEIGRHVGGWGGSMCLDGAPADRNPSLDGVQPECAVIERVGDVATPLLPCATSGGQTPCWRIEPYDRCDSSSHHLRMIVDRAVRPAVGTYLDIQCVVE